LRYFSRRKERKLSTTSKGKALITGASSGIGATYADRLARRGYELILVARNQERLQALANRLFEETGRSIEVIVADLSNKAHLARVEEVLRTDTGITMLVNNAGIGSTAQFQNTEVAKLDEMIALNVQAVVRLAHAGMTGFVARGEGSIINIGSVVGIAPETFDGIYGATKAFVLAFSQSLHHELASQNVRVQIVLPGATATEIWEKAGTSLASLPKEIVMPVEKMVDAALAGFDMGEFVTIPSLPDAADWETYEAARQNLVPKLSLSSPARRYGVVAA
jgi:short-subunit dehydrogenase